MMFEITSSFLLDIISPSFQILDLEHQGTFLQEMSKTWTHRHSMALWVDFVVTIFKPLMTGPNCQTKNVSTVL